MNNGLSTWENIAILIMMVGALIFFLPRIKHTLEQSAKAESNWLSVLIPLFAVIAFVWILIKIV